MNKKGFSTLGIIIVVVLLVALGGGYYLLQNTKAPEQPTNTTSSNTGPMSEGLISRVERKEGTFEVIGFDGKIIDTLVPSTEAARRNSSFAELSPNQTFVFYGYSVGDGSIGWIYDVRDGSRNKLMDVSGIERVISGIKPSQWLKDNRFEFYVGCVTPECTHYRSVSPDKPWIAEVVAEKL